ncbi:SIR2 family protein [Bradyrhizobium sp. SRS-191]|uniref:protein kinase domain-containing protein n=1 Tax=Bradyrhizobium sp. SRS-191 TaxID=2962606 RepID=UPI00211E5B31|nr:SIR2 family protein [Bradyrhizobium sp. SRS-191]
MDFDDKQFAFRRLAAVYAERTQPIVFFVGAGLSAPAGMPNWLQLRDHLTRVGESKFATFDLDQRAKKLADLRSVKQIPTLWAQFSRLEDLIGFATFREAILEKFAPSATLPIPKLYEGIWELNVRGVISLNLDIFARRAFASERSLTSITSRDVGQKAHILKNPKQHFLAALHGSYDDVSTWVLTERHLNRLLDDTAYLNFVNTVFTTHVIIFLGISADDIAAGGILHRLISKGIDPGNHFWMTSRSDTTTDSWAENNNLLVIRYESGHGHQAPIDSAIKFLRDFKSVDEPLPPITTSSYGISHSIESPDDLEKLAPNEIRLKLNTYAARFAGAGEIELKEYNAFLSKYKFAMHKARYVDVAEPFNNFFDFKIIDRIGSGLFGTVFKAVAKDGSFRAIKILRNEVMSNETMLQCFRRGASSMKIMDKARVAGVVKLDQALEIPPSIIMEFVEGGNLEEAKAASLLDGWIEIIGICRDVARIVKSGHLLPERVLHRDIRPANIMLRGLYTPNPREVTVLDFDLSWHVGAIGNTIAPHVMQAMGYLSPEQRGANRGSTSRSATVDTFGLSMTLYHLLTGLHPGLGEHREPEWMKIIYSRLPSAGLGDWTSLRRRVARLIATGTDSEQVRRPDMGEMEFELSRIHQCLTMPDLVKSAELIAERLFFDAFAGDYEWNDDQSNATRRLASGIEFVMRCVEDDSGLELVITFTAQGHENRKHIAKYLSKSFDQAKRLLRDNGWKILVDQVDHGTARVTCGTDIREATRFLKQWPKMLKELGDLFSFD